MELSKVDIGEESFVALLNLKLAFFFSVIVDISMVCSVCAIDHELLGDAIGLNHNVFNVEVVLIDFKRVPTFTFIPREFNGVNWRVFFCNHNNSSMITNFIDIDTLSDNRPIQSAVS